MRFLFASLLLVGALVVPAVSSAALLDTQLANEAANCGSKGQPACSLNTFVKLGVNVANFILGIVGALTLLMFVYGGLTWILSAGSSSAVQKGKDIIIGSVVGLLIVFCSYMIVNFVVNNVLGAKNITNNSTTSQPLFTGGVDNKQQQESDPNHCPNNYCITQLQCQQVGGSAIGKKDCKGDTTCCRVEIKNE